MREKRKRQKERSERGGGRKREKIARERREGEEMERELKREGRGRERIGCISWSCLETKLCLAKINQNKISL